MCPPACRSCGQHSWIFPASGSIEMTHCGVKINMTLYSVLNTKHVTARPVDKLPLLDSTPFIIHDTLIHFLRHTHHWEVKASCGGIPYLMMALRKALRWRVLKPSTYIQPASNHTTLHSILQNVQSLNCLESQMNFIWHWLFQRLSFTITKRQRLCDKVCPFVCLNAR